MENVALTTGMAAFIGCSVEAYAVVRFTGTDRTDAKPIISKSRLSGIE
jgi:hypothetical protein